MNKNRILLLAALAMSLVACTKDEPKSEEEQQPETVDVTFEVRPDGWTITREPIRTRGLDADGKAMTDIWVLDYIGTELQQQVHQSSTDDDFGKPTMNLSVGNHSIYFVASRGQNPTLDTDTKTLSFTKVLDTFYRALSLNVSATTNGSQSVDLDRCVTKFKVAFTDAIPTTAATFNVTPASWYYSIDYTTGLPTAATSSQAITVSIPAASLGKTNESVNVFGFSGAEEWTTDVSINCKDGEGNILGAATISSAKFKRNRVSAYSGPLFSSNGAMTLSLNTEWDTELTGTW